MAINWTTYKINSWNREIESTRTSHEGVVLTTAWVEEERVMSDIWANVSYCLVWNPQTNQAQRVCLGQHFELCNTFGEAIVDVDPAILATHQAQQEAARLAHEEAERKLAEGRTIERMRADWNRPEKGKMMQVIRGRKVPKGTFGRVFWVDDLRNPTRVGLTRNDVKDERGHYVNVIWVDAAYLANMAPHPTLDAEAAPAVAA